MQSQCEKYEAYAAIMSEDGPLTQVQTLLVLVHSLNRSQQLACISEDEQCDFPRMWRTPEDDVYSFTYLNPQNKALLNLTARVTGKRLEIILGEIGSKQSYRILLEIEGSMQTNAKQYDFTLQEYIKSSQKINLHNIPAKKDQPTNFNTAPKINAGHSQLSQGNLPRNLINAPEFVHNPFGQEEYIGPNSEIFTSPNNNPIFIPKIPPGARYDRVDPFDNPLIEKPTSPHDFFGFDEFGRPKRAPFQGGRGGGFNGLGGFGGSFGGFGPL